MDPESERAVLRTYRYLRVALVVLGVFLLASVGYAMANAGCAQTSISAYYYTPSHAAFIAAVCAIGVCLVAYAGGNPLEDVVLNVAGFAAFAVALSPTSRESLCGGEGLTDDYEIAPGIRNNMAALLVAIAVVLTIMIYLGRKEIRVKGVPERVVIWIGLALLLIGVVVFATAPGTFQRRAHGIAASVFFAGMIVVTVLNAWSSGERLGAARYVWAYRLVAGAMAATLAVVLGMHLLTGKVSYAIVPETLLVLEFGAFWVIQTIELWFSIDKKELTRRAGRVTG